MLAFLLIVLSVYALVNAYIFRRGWQALAGHHRLRMLCAFMFLLFVLSYPLGRIVQGLVHSGVPRFFVRVGAFHLALMLYLFIAVILVDFVRLLNRMLAFIPKAWSADPARFGAVLFLIVAGLSIIIVGTGYINAGRPRIRDITVAIDKSAKDGRSSLKAVMGSDLHLGMVCGISRLRFFVDEVNALKPDLVLLPGDIVDETVTAEEEEAMISIFRGIRAPLGVFSVLGNHEYYSGLEQNIAFLGKCGIRVLQDEAVEVAGSFVVIGRKDPTGLGRGEKRTPLARIMAAAGVDPALPLVLLDHQPLHLEQAEEAGIDLQLSGHTHAGQLFPLNLINKRLYEQNWGSLRKGKTHYYVSCGVGTWGPPVRTGSIPEIMRITLTFREAR